VFSDLAEIRTDLKERLAPDLPEEWRILDYITGPIESLQTVVYFEFTGLDSAEGGRPLGRDTVACAIDLVIASPRSDDGGAEDDVDAAVLKLAQALQASDDIFWSNGKKQRIDNGSQVWRLSLTVLTNIPPKEGA
jgi:hypothetical protein